MSGFMRAVKDTGRMDAPTPLSVVSPYIASWIQQQSWRDPVEATVCNDIFKLPCPIPELGVFFFFSFKFLFLLFFPRSFFDTLIPTLWSPDGPSLHNSSWPCF